MQIVARFIEESIRIVAIPSKAPFEFVLAAMHEA